MPSLCNVTLVGHAVREPEKRQVRDTDVASFSVPVNSGKRGTESEHTDWYRVSAWRMLATRAMERVHKGTLVMVSGRLSTRTYQAKDGTTKFSLEVEAQELVVLSGKEGAVDDPRSEAQPQRKQAKPETVSEDARFFNDDDIPF